MTSPILVLGAGGHARKVVRAAEGLSVEVRGFISTEPPGTLIHGYEVLGYLDHFRTAPSLLGMGIHIAIGENSVRRRIYQELGQHATRLVSLISSSAIVAPDAEPGAGSFVGNGVVFETGARTGRCCLVDTSAVIEHDVSVGEFVNVSPGAVICGGSTLLDGAIVGAGATIIEKVVIGENSLVGAGSVVLRDVEPNTVVVGNPARVLRRREPSERYLR
jgi:acetyltransferase EpsM